MRVGVCRLGRFAVLLPFVNQLGFHGGTEHRRQHQSHQRKSGDLRREALMLVQADDDFSDS